MFISLTKIYLIIVLTTAFLADASEAADPPIALKPVITGLVQPTQITHSGDGSGRLFLVEQTGQIRIFGNGLLSPLPFLDISDRVSCCGERGLLSIAFPPQYAQKGYFYVSYTNVVGNSVISRFSLRADPNVANPATEQILLTVTQPFSNHNGGQMAFGPDGFLYVGFGDGGSAGDPNNFAQNLNDLPGNQKLLGKMLRIDVESGTSPYSIPPTNPQLNGVQSEIWALGFRNPWRFSFDRQTGDLYIADVGQGSYEEVDFQPATSQGGENYGWRLMEGNHCFNPAANCNDGTLTLPIQEYDHTQGDCSVTGGFVYRGTRYAPMQGVYFYGDFCSGRIWGLRVVSGAWQNQLLIDSPMLISTFGEDENGDIYVADYGSGIVYNIVLSVGQATLVFPSGAIVTNTPTYTWNAVSDSTWYYLWVNDSTGNKIKQWYTRGEAGCASGTGTCSVTPTTEVIGSCNWWVQTYNDAGYGPWSTPLSFTTPIPTPPPAPTLISPTGTIADTTPPYTWNAISNATWYHLWVNDSTGNRINQWYTRGEAGCGSGIGTCSVTPTMEVRGSSQWWLQAYNAAGFGPWNGPFSFTAPTPLLPIAATLASPSGGITDTTPTYTWNPIANATWYQLWVNDSTGNKINQWYAVADVGCADGVGSCSATPTTEVRGASQWWIRTYNSGGYGPWSLPGLLFTAPTLSAPSAATQISPSGTINDITPTYTWNPVATATWYQLWVGDSSGNKINQWYAAADAGCADGVGSCSVTPMTIVLGPMSWYIRSYNSGGLGPWSLPGLPFTVSP